MRQVGVLAAAGLIALEETPQAAALRPRQRALSGRRPGAHSRHSNCSGSVATNIVVFDVSGTGIAPAEISARLKRRGVLMNAINDRQMRAVTHYDVDRAACAQGVWRPLPKAVA